MRLRTANPSMFHEDDDAEDILAWLYHLKRVSKRDGVWWAEFFGGTEIELHKVVWAYRFERYESNVPDDDRFHQVE